MAVRRSLVDEAGRRARRQVDEVARGLRDARLAAGVRQLAVARALGITRQLLSLWERQRVIPDPIQLARWGAVVGRDVRLGMYAGGSPLRDVGHLRLLERARRAFAGVWKWRTEVPVSSAPLDRRAIDVVVVHGAARVGLELITRLTDVQGQVRQANLKQEASGLDRMILVMSDTRHNREAIREGRAYLEPTFPIAPRLVLAALRDGRLPPGNGIVLL